MTVREWMSTPPIVTTAELPAPQALQLMEARKIRRLPVVDEGGRLVGIVTKGDLQAKLGPFASSWRRLKLHVTDAMTRNPVTVGPEDALERVAQLMLSHKISGIPVVEGTTVVGLITESDVFRAFCRAQGLAESADVSRRAPAAR